MLDALFKIIQHQGTQSSTGLLIPLEDTEKLILQTTTSISNITKNDCQSLKRCEEYFGYVEPLKIKLNDQDDCGYYVTIQQSIKNLLNKPNVISYLVDNLNDNITQTKNDPDLMLTYRDGTGAKDNPSLKLYPNSFLIQLYSDGISVTNPISPKNDEHKLTLYYFVLEDLPDVVRSMLQSIGLVGICTIKYLSLQTNRIKYFESIVKDLNYLQTAGLTVQTFNGQLHFAFSLLAADNLASHEIGGFQRNFNSGQFCRLCHISYQFRLTLLTDISFLPHTEPVVPTPCIKVSNEKFQLYLDWQVAVETTSPTPAFVIIIVIIQSQQLQTHSTATTTESVYSSTTLNTEENESPQSMPLIIADQEQQPHDNSLIQIHELQQIDVGIETASSSAVHSGIEQIVDTKRKFSNSSNIQHKLLKDAINSEASTVATKGEKRKLRSSPKQQKLSSRLAAKRNRQNVSSFQG
ncbi:unnamed protein product [Rotaria sordida]|uniref:Uncharacterized protein n=1 Tax=Rotaria sordida TaxID=392033 RepID=A0A819TJ85_9BILA|nr:unnamed protein product [Rotaria sordida]